MGTRWQLESANCKVDVGWMKPVYFGRMLLKVGAKIPPHWEVELGAWLLTSAKHTVARQAKASAWRAIAVRSLARYVQQLLSRLKI